jgi:hypothetical protein
MAKIHSSLSELEGGPVLVGNQVERSFNRDYSFGYETLNKFDTGLFPGMNQETNRAENQRSWALPFTTGAGRVVMSAIFKTLEGASTVPTLFNENPLSETFAEAEKHVLDEWLPVYKSAGVESDNLMDRLREPGWWASTAADGAAFMLSAIIGAKGINAVTKIPKIARLAKTRGAYDDLLMQIGNAQRSTVGKLLALDKPGIAFATGYNAFNEAGFEARGVFDNLKNELAKEYGGEFDYLDPETQQQILNQAGEAAQATFWYNVPMLLLSERIFNETILGNFFGLPEASAFKRIVKEGAEVAVKPLTKMQRAALLGLPFAANIPTEAFQENYQLAVENYFTARAKAGEVVSIFDSENLGGIAQGMIDNFSTVEGQESMFLGALLGGLGGAMGLGGLSKSEKKAQQYADVLNKGLTNLNQSGIRFFQTNADGSIMMKNGTAVAKTPEQFQKDWDNISDNFAKYQLGVTLEVLSELGDATAKDLIEIDKSNAFSDLAFQFFGLDGGNELFNQIIEDYANKIKTEYGSVFQDKTVGELSDELKGQAKRLETLYNLAKDYYAIEGQEASLPLQYQSLWKQDFYKTKFKELQKQLNESLAGVDGETKTKIQDIVENPTSAKIKSLDAIINSIDFGTADNATTALDVQNKAAKALSYKSLYSAEKTRFEKELTQESFYENLKKKVEEETTKAADEEAKQQAQEERKQALEAEKLAKQQATQQPPAQPTVQPQQQAATPVQPKKLSAQEQIADINKRREDEVRIAAKEVHETGFYKGKEYPGGWTEVEKELNNKYDAELATIETQPEVVPETNRKDDVKALVANKKSVTPTTVNRELGIKNAKEILDELVAEGVVEKKGSRYIAKDDVSQQESQVEPDVNDIEAKKADIERRRQESLSDVSFIENLPSNNNYWNAGYNNLNSTNEAQWDGYFTGKSEQEVIDKINAKYDAELAALETQPIEFTEPVEEEITPNTPLETPTDKEIQNQHENVIKSNPEYILATEAISEGHNALAMRVVKMEKVFNGDVVVRQNANDFELDETGITAYMHSNVKTGDKLVIKPAADSRNTQMYVDIKNDKTITFGEKIDSAPIEEYYETVVDNLPLEIYHDNVFIGYVHTVDWIDTSNITPVEGFLSIEEQKAALREFRQQFVNEDGSVKSIEVDSSITFKGTGKLAKASTEMPVSQAVPSFPIVVATSSNTVKTMDGKEIQLSHNVKKGMVGTLVDNKFFVAKRKQLDDSHKQILAEELNRPVKNIQKIGSMVYVSTASSVETASDAARKQSSPNRYRLVVSKDNYWVYDKTQKQLFAANTNLDLYLNQPLVANVVVKNTPENLQWAGEMLTTNIREIKADYDGNVEPTIFVHNVIKFDMPVNKPETLKETPREMTTEEFDELSDFLSGNSLYPKVSNEALELIKKCK